MSSHTNSAAATISPSQIDEYSADSSLSGSGSSSDLTVAEETTSVTTANSLSTIYNIPNEVLGEILSFMNIRALIQFASSCQEYRWLLTAGELRKECWTHAALHSTVHRLIPGSVFLRDQLRARLHTSPSTSSTTIAATKCKCVSVKRCACASHVGAKKDTTSIDAQLLSPGDLKYLREKVIEMGTTERFLPNKNCATHYFYRIQFILKSSRSRTSSSALLEKFPWSPFRSIQHYGLSYLLSNLTEDRLVNFKLYGSAAQSVYDYNGLYGSTRHLKSILTVADYDNQITAVQEDLSRCEALAWMELYRSTLELVVRKYEDALDALPNATNSAINISKSAVAGSPEMEKLNIILQWSKLNALYHGGSYGFASDALEQFPCERLSYLQDAEVLGGGNTNTTRIIPFSKATAKKALMPMSIVEYQKLCSSVRMKALDTDTSSGSGYIDFVGSFSPTEWFHSDGDDSTSDVADDGESISCCCRATDGGLSASASSELRPYLSGHNTPHAINTVKPFENIINVPGLLSGGENHQHRVVVEGNVPIDMTGRVVRNSRYPQAAAAYRRTHFSYNRGTKTFASVTKQMANTKDVQCVSKPGARRSGDRQRRVFR